MPDISLDSVTPTTLTTMPGENIATVKFTPSTDDGSPITGYRIRVEGPDPESGGDAGSRGVFTDTATVPFDLDDFSAPSGTQITEDVTDIDLTPFGGGPRTVYIWAYSDTEGWNA